MGPDVGDEEGLFERPPLVPDSRQDRGRQVDPRLFEDRPHTRARQLKTLGAARGLARRLRSGGYKVVLTSGSFDLLHLGHAMYLEQARRMGDFLIVGLDSDRKISLRKGPDRPYVAEDVRSKFLTYQRGVGAVYIKGPEDPRWSLIDHVRPAVLVATKGTYSHPDVEEIEKRYKTRVVILDRMIPTSSDDRAKAIRAGEPLRNDQRPLFDF